MALYFSPRVGSVRRAPPVQCAASACAYNMAVAQLPPEIEYKDSGYVARAVVFALMCFGCFLGLLLWIGEVIIFIVSIK